ncbi:MAG: regulatory protein RecX [Armatimonadia bacterium]
MTGENIITAVESSKRGRRAIFVDGQCVLDLPKAFVDQTGLRVGQSLLPDQQDEIRQAAALQEARTAAVRALGRRALTRADLRRRLSSRGLPETAVEQTLNWLADRKYLDDEQYAQQRWQALAQRKLGAQGIAWKLAQEGVPKDVIQKLQAQQTEELNETELARELAERREATMQKVPWPQRRGRLYVFLARRGFGSDAIAEALERLEAARESEDE